MANFLRSFDFYRSTAKKDKKAVSIYDNISVELPTTLQGQCCTLLTFILIVALFFMEFSAYMRSSDRYDVVLADKTVTDGTLQVNFNLSFPHLPCKFASVDIKDITHTRRINVTKNVRKFLLSKSGRIVGEEQNHKTVEKGEHEELPASHPIHERMKDPNKEDYSEHLTEDTYDEYVNAHDVVVVNFFAPWCHWCRKFEPVFEHTAGELLKKKYVHTVAFARVNCVRWPRICMRHMIRGYPTVLTYQQGTTNLQNPYRGPRTTQALLDYVEHLQTVASKIASGVYDNINSVPKEDPRGESEGCMITGTLQLKRVPGSLTVTAHSEWHSFEENQIDVSHAVNHFSFGELARRSPRLMQHTASLDGVVMDAKTRRRITHHHYMKIVETFFDEVYMFSYDHLKTMFGMTTQQAYTYQFTKHSHSYVTPKGNGPAQARFQFDIDPMAIKVSVEEVPTMRFITSMCAIVGGAYAVMGLIDGTLFGIFG
jgi:thiol-disulfide isomerase/thioredoxin